MEKKMIQYYPSVDSPNNDAFEGVVELYYQSKGYITSSGKWFWKKSGKKNQPNFQDIDVLAINEKETIIVSVSTKLSSKISKQNFEHSIEFFKSAEDFLKETYGWLTDNKRKVKRVIACAITETSTEKIDVLKKDHKIEVLQREEILNDIISYIDKRDIDGEGVKFQDQTMRFLQILLWSDVSTPGVLKKKNMILKEYKAEIDKMLTDKKKKK